MKLSTRVHDGARGSPRGSAGWSLGSEIGWTLAYRLEAQAVKRWYLGEEEIVGHQKDPLMAETSMVHSMSKCMAGLDKTWTVKVG